MIVTDLDVLTSGLYESIQTVILDIQTGRDSGVDRTDDRRVARPPYTLSSTRRAVSNTPRVTGSLAAHRPMHSDRCGQRVRLSVPLFYLGL